MPRNYRPSVRQPRYKKKSYYGKSGKRSSARRYSWRPSSSFSAWNNRRLAGYVGLEKKFFDTGLVGGVPSASATATSGEIDPTTIDCLNAVALGDGPTQRDGRQINMMSITVKGNVFIPAQADQTAADTMPNIFIALVLDTQTNAAQAQSEQVFTNPGASASTANQPFLNLENHQRFRVLKTVRIAAEQIAGCVVPVYDGSNIEQSGASVPWSMYVNLKQMKVNFLSAQTTSVIAAIADNSLHLIAFTDNTSTSAIINYNARLRFMG